METKTDGQIAFEAYNDAVGGRTWDDRPIPGWHEVTDKVRNGWEQAASAVIREICRKVMSG